MCDYSLQTVRSRPAKVGEKLKTQHFNTGTIGFAAPEDCNTAVCVLPGTELAFAKAVSCRPHGLLGWKVRGAITAHLPTSVLYSGHICDLDHAPHSACLRAVIWITANVLKST